MLTSVGDIMLCLFLNHTSDYFFLLYKCHVLTVKILHKYVLVK